MTLTVSLPTTSYDVVIERNALSHIADYIPLERRILIVTDDGVPACYAEAVAKVAKEAIIARLPQGEGTKSLKSFEKLLGMMLEAGFTRHDAVVAVGGGVVGDLAGFTASAYMRGVDFYNIPTTLLSQVDSSIGGKTAVNFGSIKNPIGAFYHPKKVVIDPTVLSTLPARHIAAGFAEIVKMAMTFDSDFFASLEQSSLSLDTVDTAIYQALCIKKAVVEADEKESGLRRVLNFGHTLGHAIESEQAAHGLYHGECVALGMLPMCSDEARERLIPLLEKLSLPTSLSFDKKRATAALFHDKKTAENAVNCVFVKKIGSYEIKKIPFDELTAYFDYFC